MSLRDCPHGRQRGKCADCDVAELERENERLQAEITEDDGVIMMWRRRCQEAEAEAEEQARLNGMGSEREARLMAERDHWKREAKRISVAYDMAELELAALKEQKDGAYLERNHCVALAGRMAVAMGLPVAVTKTAIEGWSEDWHGCIYIGLPTGQVSWHFHDSHAHLFDGLPQRAEVWDGHDTPEKYRRVDAHLSGNAKLAALKAQEPVAGLLRTHSNVVECFFAGGICPVDGHTAALKDRVEALPLNHTVPLYTAPVADSQDAERLNALLLALEVAHPQELAVASPEDIAAVGRAIAAAAKKGAHLLSPQELTAAMKGVERCSD